MKNLIKKSYLILIIILAGCNLAPRYEIFKPTSKVTVIKGTYKKGSNVAEPRPVESKYLRVESGGVIIIPSGAGFYLQVAVKEHPQKNLHIVIEYENPNDKSKPLVNTQELLASSEGFYFSSPSVIKGIKFYSDYTIKVKIFESKKKEKLLDQFTQTIRSYVDTTTDNIFIKTGMTN